jgi:hypothetical protein
MEAGGSAGRPSREKLARGRKINKVKNCTYLVRYEKIEIERGETGLAKPGHRRLFSLTNPRHGRRAPWVRYS